MNPRVKLILFGAAGSALGISIGADIANESYSWAILAGLACAWLVIRRLSPALPDAWLTAVVLVGYVVGNRGFAQLQPSNLVPMLPAEAVLLVAAPALLARMALKKSAGVRRDALNYSILAWMLMGVIRLPLDMSRFGVIALRDFAMVYYAAFFFIGQDLNAHKASASLLRSSITVAFIALLPAVISIQLAPDFLLDHFTWREMPVIYHKSDLIATSLAAGFFWLWCRWEKSGRRIWLPAAAASLLLIGAMASPRAGMVGIAVTTALWLINRRWRILAAQVGIVASASLIAVAALSFTGSDIKTSAPYSMYEHAISIFDPAGTGTYINAESGDPGGNNRFRWIWWRDVVEDTVEAGPVFGQGFGSDLSTRFLADYDLLSDESFAARSPHSMLVTVIGRMGFAGFAAWMAVSGAVAALVWRLMRQGDPDAMGLASITTVVWLSSCVGVVLEAPMGAVVFWTVLGMANSSLARSRPPGPPKSPGGPAEKARDEWPVAKSAALPTHSSPR